MEWRSASTGARRPKPAGRRWLLPAVLAATVLVVIALLGVVRTQYARLLDPPERYTAAPLPLRASPTAAGSRLVAAALVEKHVVIGRSVRGVPILAIERYIGPIRRRVLVVGSVHGDEPAGIAVAQLLERLRPPVGTALWIIPDLNPDGAVAGTRGNADGVDLNRNFAYLWSAVGRPGDPQYSGTGPLSEPESRAAAALVTRLHPAVTVWFHQPLGIVDESGGDLRVEARYAGRARLPLRRLPRYPGSAAGWENHTFPGTTAFVVELPAKADGAAVARCAAAVNAL